jgi:hypothetical protein
MNSEADERALRSWVAGRLRRKEVPDYVWRTLTHLLSDSGVLEGEITKEDLARRARRLLAYEDIVGALSATPDWYETSGYLGEAPQLNDYEWARTRVLGQYVALRAAMLFEVTFLRDYASFLCSPETIEEVRESPRQWRKILNLGGAENDMEKPDRSDQSPIANAISRQLGNYWKSNEIMDFVWADRVHARSPLEVSFDASVKAPSEYGTINIQVEPWVSPETVMSFYQYYQKAILGHRPRELSLRNLEVARFIMEQLRGAWYKELLDMGASVDAGKPLYWYKTTIGHQFPLIQEVDLSRGPSWKLLLSLWNQEHSESRYENEGSLRRDFYRAARAVTYPYKPRSETEAG